MKRKIITTADGSKTIYLTDWNENYHSKHGAVQESKYVFIEQGLKHFYDKSLKENIDILEIGFGTGLNALLTHNAIQYTNSIVNYVGVEAFPLNWDDVCQLNYAENNNQTSIFRKLHQISWEEAHEINNRFTLTKRKLLFSEIEYDSCFDIIYFDAFGARVQPELWKKSIFEKMFDALKPDGVLVTYAAIGQVKRDMLSLGFSVERLQGPPGKRHMLRATK